jgi:aryl-alcohol dehydrogenase-like predicted oxidoreductase
MRRWITEAVEGSLRRLQTDWIDLYQVGVPDPNTDIDETLGALSDLMRAGKIRSFGASKVPASQIVEAQWTADRRGYGRFRTEQPPYSLLTRAIEYDLLPACLRHGMGVMAYSPLAGGWLSGKYRKGQQVSGPGSAARRQRFAATFDAANPANAAKLDAADAPRRARRRGRADPRTDGGRVRHPPPRGHLRDHRPAHHGAPARLSRRRRDRAVRRRA